METKRYFKIFTPKTGFYLWVIFILILVVAYLDWKFAVPGLLLFTGLVFYFFKSSYTRKQEITKYIENLNFNIDTVTKNTLLNFPMPFVVVELGGKIIWYNSYFREIFDEEDILEESINTLVKGLDTKEFKKEAISISKEVLIGNKTYLLLGNYIQVEKKVNSSGYILFIYLIDRTEYVELKERYNDEKVAVSLIVIDNYDDLMQSMDDSKRPYMLAEIDKRIVDWMSFTNGIIKKFERDKYLFVFEKKYLKEIQEKKFEILDIVKEIDIGNKLPVTLSLGIGLNGQSFIESFKFAAFSLDIALGRGGDQVALKAGEEIEFFGGKTKEYEKKTRVKARVVALALRELIDQASDVMIMGHINCDLDSLGAALGLYRIAKNRQRNSHIVLNNSNSTIDYFVEKINQDDQYEEVFINSWEAVNKITKNTLLIVVDTNKPSITESPELLTQTKNIVVIDHHRRSADAINNIVLAYQETYASSTCEMVTEILQYVEENIKLSLIESAALYAGILMDTKKFAYKTGVRTFEAAAFLRRQGAETNSIKHVFQYDLDTFIKISGIVKKSEVIYENIALSVAEKDAKNIQLIAAQAADQLLGLTGIAAAFVLGYSGHDVFISGRSLGDINVQVILEKLGGGGHYTVAGAKISGTTAEDVMERLKTAIAEYLEDNKEV